MATLEVTSPAFQHEQLMPSKCTCDGDDASSVVAVSENPFADVANGKHRANYRRRRRKSTTQYTGYSAPEDDGATGIDIKRIRMCERWVLDMVIGPFCERDSAYSVQTRWKSARGIEKRRTLGRHLSEEHRVECYDARATVESSS